MSELEGMEVVITAEAVPVTTSDVLKTHGNISSRFCGIYIHDYDDQYGYFKPSDDVFITLTNCILYLYFSHI